MEADLTQRARLVPSHSLYLLHGLADLTAPYTHGIAFAKALSEAGVIFRYQVSSPFTFYILYSFHRTLENWTKAFCTFFLELRGRRSRLDGSDRARLSFHGGLSYRVPHSGCLLVPRYDFFLVFDNQSIHDMLLIVISSNSPLLPKKSNHISQRMYGETWTTKSIT